MRAGAGARLDREELDRRAASAVSAYAANADELSRLAVDGSIPGSVKRCRGEPDDPSPGPHFVADAHGRLWHMSYGPNFNDMYRYVAFYIDKILKGAKPADLPVEQASTYVFVLNMVTARILKVDVPAILVARADEVIE